MPEAVLDRRPVPRRLRQPLRPLAHARPVVGVDALPDHRARELPGGVAEDALDRRAVVAHAAARAEDRDDVGSPLDEQLEVLLPAAQRLLGLRLEEAAAVSAQGLGAVERLRRRLEEVGGAGHRGLVGSDAHGEGELHPVSPFELVHALADPLREGLCALRPRAAEDGKELVPSVAPGRVHPAGLPLENVRDSLQSRVALSAPELLMVGPQAVHVEQDDG